jgi:RND superfamily putative drug exporter
VNIAAQMGRWSARHRTIAILGWIVFVVAAAVLGGMTGTKQITAAENGSGDSMKAGRLFDQAGFERAASENVLIQQRGDGSADELHTAADAVAAAVERTGVVHGLREPLESADGRSLLVQFDVNGDPATAVERIQPVLDAVTEVQGAHPNLRVEQFGDASATKAFDETLGKDFKRAELLAIPLTLGILLVAFGAVVAALVPLVLALTAFVAATGLLAFTSQLIHVDATANSVMLLIGLAVGVDYSLFYLKREREERARGASPEAALAAAAATSGRSVLISGITVVIALAGMFLTDQAVFLGVAQGTILVVAAAVLGSLTILPAVMAWLGDRIEKGRIPFVNRQRSTSGQSRVWSALLSRVLRRPLLGAVLAGGAMVALTLPVTTMKTAVPGAADIPKGLPIMQSYERIQAAFPGGPMPAHIVFSAPDVNAPEVQRALDALSAAATASGQMGDVVSTMVNESSTVAVVSIPLHGTGNDAESNAALDTLRKEIVPTTIGAVDGVKAYVSGETAGSRDFTDQLRARGPWVFAFVLGLAFVLLLVAFRSIVVSVIGIVLNLLSVGAAYGVMVLIFQHHWFDSVLGFTATGMITAWVPLFLFVILFGLSMDYHVFILSRIRENHDRGMPTKQAIQSGLASTAGVITSAAVIMIAVFSVFATLSQVSMKQIGIGLAVAVLLDATVVRAVLLPSVMTLLGERNWYLPRWLGWLPQVALESVPAEEPTRVGV